MNNNTRNEMAQHSLGILKLAVLDVLYQQRKCQRYSDHNSVQLRQVSVLKFNRHQIP